MIIDPEQLTMLSPSATLMYGWSNTNEHVIVSKINTSKSLKPAIYVTNPLYNKLPDEFKRRCIAANKLNLRGVLEETPEEPEVENVEEVLEQEEEQEEEPLVEEKPATPIEPKTFSERILEMSDYDRFNKTQKEHDRIKQHRKVIHKSNKKIKQIKKLFKK